METSLRSIQKRSKEIFRKRYSSLKIDKRLLAVGILILFISIFDRRFFFVTLFTTLNCLLLSLERRFNFSMDIELSTFSAVLFTSSYGLVWGLAMAFLTRAAGSIYNSSIRIDHFFMVGGYMIAAVIAALMPGLDVLVIGIISTIVVNIYVYFISRHVTMLSMFEIVIYGSTNIIFNLLVFSIFAIPVRGLM